MILKTDEYLKNFEFWGNAKTVAGHLTDEELDRIEDFLEDAWPEGMDECTLNDMFAFDADFIVSIIGYEDYEQFLEERKDEE